MITPSTMVAEERNREREKQRERNKDGETDRERETERERHSMDHLPSPSITLFIGPLETK